MAAPLFTWPIFYATDADGRPLAGGKLYSFAAGTSEPLSTLAADGVSANENPTILDANGQAIVRLRQQAYKFDLFDANDVHQPLWPVDHVTEAAPWPVVTATVPSVAGAAVLTAAAVLPAGSPILTVSTKILVEFGTSNGLSGFAVGDAVSMDRWGVQDVLTVGALSGSSDAPEANQVRDGSMPRYTTATAVMISALGGLFDSNGRLELAVQYLSLAHRST